MRQITIRLADPSDAAALCDMHQILRLMPIHYRCRTPCGSSGNTG